MFWIGDFPPSSGPASREDQGGQADLGAAGAGRSDSGFFDNLNKVRGAGSETGAPRSSGRLRPVVPLNSA